LGKNSGIGGFETIIGANAVIEGNINAHSSVRVEGRVEGNIIADGDVFVGKKAQVKGDISADNVHLCGIVNGHVKSTGLLKIQSTAKLYGDITINSFVADEGSVFQGNCNMLDSNTEKSKNSAKKNKSDFNNEFKSDFDNELDSSQPKKRSKKRKRSVLEDLYDEDNAVDIL
jgi:cytoskeletal protein CcmA (bactofilin family)